MLLAFYAYYYSIFEARDLQLVLDNNIGRKKTQKNPQPHNKQHTLKEDASLMSSVKLSEEPNLLLCYVAFGNLRQLIVPITLSFFRY